MRSRRTGEPPPSADPAGALDLLAACKSDPRRLQHLHDAGDTVDVEHQPLDRREAGWPRS